MGSSAVIVVEKVCYSVTRRITWYIFMVVLYSLMIGGSWTFVVQPFLELCNKLIKSVHGLV